MSVINPHLKIEHSKSIPLDDAVERRLPIAQLFTLGLQHVLVMYAGAVAVPLVIGGSLGLPKDQIAF